MKALLHSLFAALLFTTSCARHAPPLAPPTATAMPAGVIVAVGERTLTVAELRERVVAEATRQQRSPDPCARRTPCPEPPHVLVGRVIDERTAQLVVEEHAARTGIHEILFTSGEYPPPLARPIPSYDARMTPARFRKLALSLEGVTEVPHMDRAAFRTKRKIFATLGADKRVNMMVQPADRRDSLIEAFPDTFVSLGGWSRLGYIGVDLATVEEGLLRELLDDAWHDALPAAKAPRKKTPKKKRSSR